MNQVILSADLVKKVERLSKELDAVKREVKNAVRISKSQAWFWSKSWQRKERQADKAIKEGRVSTFSSAKDLVDDLHG